MLATVIGRSIAQRTGFQAGAYKAGARAGVQLVLRRKTDWLIAQVEASGDARTARRRLATYWLRAHKRALEIERVLVHLEPGTKDRESVEVALMSQLAHLAVVAAPLFDDLPLRAAGLSSDDETGAVPVWHGTTAQIIEATGWLVERGLTYAEAGEARVEVKRGEHAVARLVAVDEHVTPADAGPAPLLDMPRTAARVWLWLGGLVATVVVAGALDSGIALAIGVAILALAVPLTRVVTRRRLAAAWHRAVVSPGAVTALAGPFRDQHALERVPTATVVAALRDGGLTVSTERGRIQLEGDAAVVEAAPTGDVGLVALAVRYRDPRVAMRAAFALADRFGPLAVELGGATLVADPGHGYPRWLDDYQGDRAARAAMADAMRATL